MSVKLSAPSLQQIPPTGAMNLRSETEPVDFPRRPMPGQIVLAIGLMIAGLACIPFDRITSVAMVNVMEWVGLEQLYSTARQWPTYTTLIACGGVIWTLDPRRRATLFVLLIAVIIGWIGNETIKQTTGRARPKFGLALAGKYERELSQIVAQYPKAPLSVKASDQWLLLRPGRFWFKSDFSSFPSGHAQGAFLFSAFLCVLYPRARGVWWFFAIACALSRVASGMHYPSDCLFGAGLGLLAAQWVFSWHWPIALGHKVLGRPVS